MKLREALAYRPVELPFGTSGLRGLASDMTDLECYINTSGFLCFAEESDGLKKGESVCIAGDLRDSTPRIMRAVARAIEDSGYEVVNCGLIPTPALAYYAFQQRALAVMVTGSHIPADRNGLKFYKRGSEVLKEDEAAIHEAVATVRARLYAQSEDVVPFRNDGSLTATRELGAIDEKAIGHYTKRYMDVFSPNGLAGMQIVVYQQSAVGRDLLVRLLEALGAEVVPVERSEIFVPIDTENITSADRARFKSFSKSHPEAFAIVSTDGDSDRPIVIDEVGEFHRGDVVGCVVARYLGIKAAAVPVSSNDAVDEFCQKNGIVLTKTKIGSPYVITAMNAFSPALRPVASWEVNGGFLVGSDVDMGGAALGRLPTRDAMLPILATLLSAAQRREPLSKVFSELPHRFTDAGLVDDVPEDQLQRFRVVVNDDVVMRGLVDRIFSKSQDKVVKLDLTDGLRLAFASGDVLHFRPSGNAPQFRVYANAATQIRARELVRRAAVPDGWVAQLLKETRLQG